jgi:hypothetical protein
METEKKERARIVLCYVGKRITGKGKLYFAYLPLSQPGQEDIINEGEYKKVNNSDLKLYDKMTDWAIGTILEGECDADNPTFIYPGGLKRDGRWKNKSNLNEWTAAHRMAKTEFEMNRLDKRLKDQDAFIQAMEPLQRMYQKLPFYQRTAFEVLVINHLSRKPKSEKED